MHSTMPTPVIIDFEGTGFDADSYPIEVGFVMQDGEGWCSLIRPDATWQQWDPALTKNLQISRATLIESGHSPAYVADQLNHYLAGSVAYTEDALHHAAWLARLFNSAGRVPFFKLQDVRHALTAEQKNHWKETRAQVLEELALSRHRASMDARVLQMTWQRTLELG